MVRNGWNVQIAGQQHKIEVQSKTIAGIFASGGGRLVVNDEIVCSWGCNPFTLIPKGRLGFDVAGKRAFIVTRGRICNSLALILDAQEMPAVIIKP